MTHLFPAQRGLGKIPFLKNNLDKICIYLLINPKLLIKPKKKLLAYEFLDHPYPPLNSLPPFGHSVP